MKLNPKWLQHKVTDSDKAKSEVQAHTTSGLTGGGRGAGRQEGDTSQSSPGGRLASFLIKQVNTPTLLSPGKVTVGLTLW